MVALTLTWNLLTGVALADPPEIRMDRTELQVGEIVRAEVVVTEGKPTNLPDLRAPEGLHLAFAGQTNSTSFVNGVVTRELIYAYEISAREEGTYTLGPTRVPMRRGMSEPSNSLTIEVTASDTPEGDAPLSLEAWFDPTEVWVGQVIPYQAILKAREDIARTNFAQVPSSEGVQPLQAEPTQTTRHGRDERGSYDQIEVSIPYQAVQPGTWPMEGAVLRANVIENRRGRSPFGFSSMFAETRPVILRGDPVEVVVKPLPPGPEGALPVVGDFRLRAAPSIAKPRVGDAITWVLQLEGLGDLTAARIEPLTDLPRAQVYDVERRETSEWTKEGLRSVLRLEQKVVPLRQGPLEFPAQQITVFSTVTGTWQTLTTEPVTLRVRKGASTELEVSSFADEEGTPALPEGDEAVEGIRPRGPDHVAHRAGPLLWLSWLLFLPAAMLSLVQLRHPLRRWWSARPQQGPRPASFDERLAALPDDPDALAAAAHQLLRDLLSHGGEGPLFDDARQLEAELSASRYGQAPLPGDLHPRLARLRPLYRPEAR